MYQIRLFKKDFADFFSKVTKLEISSELDSTGDHGAYNVSALLKGPWVVS